MKTSKQYTDNQIRWVVKYITTELRSVRRAVDKVESTNEKAVNKVETKTTEDKASANEFRGQLKDQAGTFVTRRELWAAIVIFITLAVSVFALLLKMK